MSNSKGRQQKNAATTNHDVLSLRFINLLLKRFCADFSFVDAQLGIISILDCQLFSTKIYFILLSSLLYIRKSLFSSTKIYWEAIT